MAEQRLQQSPAGSASSGGHRHGCMWGLLHIMHFQQLFHMRKHLTYKRHHNHNRKHTAGTKSPKTKGVHSNYEDHEFLESDLPLQVEHNVSAGDRSAAEAPLRIKISKKRSKERDKKCEISPWASRLLRTLSIHRSECNDYDIRSHLESDGEPSTASSHWSNPSSSTEHLALLHSDPDEPILGEQTEGRGAMSSANLMDHYRFDELGNHLTGNELLFREKLIEVKDAMLREKIIDEQVDDISLNQSKLFSDMLELFNGNKELFLKVLQDPSFGLLNYLQSQGGCSSDVILTRSGSLPGARLQVRQDGQSLEHVHKKNINKHESLIDQEEKFQADDGAYVLEPVATAEAGLAVKKSISLNRYNGNDFEFSAGSPSKLKYRRHDRQPLNRFKDIKKRIKDVIRENRKEKYRISMDGILHKIPFGRKLSKGMQNDASRNKFVGSKRSDKGIARSYSLTESLDRYAHLLDISSNKENKRVSERLMSMQQSNGVQFTNFPTTLGRIFSLPELESYIWRKDDQSEEFDAALLEKIPTMDVQDSAVAVNTRDFDEPKVVSDPVHKEESLGSDSYVEYLADVNDSRAIYKNQHHLKVIDEGEKCETYIIADNLVERSELKTTCSHFDEKDSLTIPPSQLLNVDVLNVDDKIDISRGTAYIDTSNIRVDQRDEANFNLVKKMLNKSRFNSGNLYKELYQKYLPEDTLLDNVDGEHDMSPDQQLLFDLINEVLLEVYDDSHAHSLRFLQHDSHFRKVPVGYHLLEDVWARIRWHLSCHAHHDPGTESLAERDFAKHDRWMNLQFDTEHTGLDLEDMILDDLVDEVTLQFCDS